MKALSQHKARGAFFTPPRMAEFIVEWAIRDKSDAVLEPSCGEAAFLLPTVHKLVSKGASQKAISRQLSGAELHEPSAQEACRLVAEATRVDLSDSIGIGDFFTMRAGQDLPFVDACVGNPPYIRYQDFSGDARKNGREAALLQGVRLDGLASSWAPFTVHAASFVKEGGRLGLVLPAELLSVNYAAPVRRFLLERFGCVRVILFEERVFPGVLEEVVLLLAEGSGPCDKFDLVQVSDLEHLPDLVDRDWGALPHHGKWTDLLLPSDVAPAVSAVEATDTFVELTDLASVSIGMVTGANSFFCVSDAERKARRIPKRDLLPMMPPGSKHIRGFEYSADDRATASNSGERVWLFYPSAEPSREAMRKIREGAHEGLDNAYKCRVRSPWHRVPLVRPPDFFLTYMTASGPRLVRNDAGLINVNSVHSVYLKKQARVDCGLFAVACMSSMTMLSAELVGRAYGGGLLKLEPREAARLAVPSARLISRARRRLEAALPEIDIMTADKDYAGITTLVDEIILRQTLGLGAEVVDALRRGRDQLHGRRVRRSQS